jgi:membrane protease YdiL (CAAX protease family)
VTTTAGQRPAPPAPPPGPERRVLVREVWLVLALSLGASAAYAVLDFARDLARAPLHRQVAVLAAPVAPGQPNFDLAYQLLGIAVTLVPVALVAHLLALRGESVRDLGIDASRPAPDAATGAAIAAVVGGAGLGLYVLAYRLGIDVRVVPSSLPAVWWRIPVLLLDAVQNGVLEEVIVCAYLLHRLRQLGFGDSKALVLSALLRGSYHLYQGVGGFLGNAAMGALFGRYFQRRGRAMPLIVAHALIDAAAFVGSVGLHGHVSWLP